MSSGHLYFPSEIHAANYTEKPHHDVRQQGDMRRHIPHWNESIFPELCDANVTKGNHVVGVITEWLRAYQFISGDHAIKNQVEYVPRHISFSMNTKKAPFGKFHTFLRFYGSCSFISFLVLVFMP
jgi:hypothetical protein